MILQTIKQISCLLCLCCFLQQSAFSQDDKDKPAIPCSTTQENKSATEN